MLFFLVGSKETTAFKDSYAPLTTSSIKPTQQALVALNVTIPGTPMKGSAQKTNASTKNSASKSTPFTSKPTPLTSKSTPNVSKIKNSNVSSPKVVMSTSKVTPEKTSNTNVPKNNSKNVAQVTSKKKK